MVREMAENRQWDLQELYQCEPCERVGRHRSGRPEAMTRRAEGDQRRATPEVSLVAEVAAVRAICDLARSTYLGNRMREGRSVAVSDRVD